MRDNNATTDMQTTFINNDENNVFATSITAIEWYADDSPHTVEICIAGATSYVRVRTGKVVEYHGFDCENFTDEELEAEFAS